jgi:hypothetical protein
MLRNILYCLAFAGAAHATALLDASITFNVNIQDFIGIGMVCSGANFTGCSSPFVVETAASEPNGFTTGFTDTGPIMSGYAGFFALDASNGDVAVGFNNGITAVANPWPFATTEVAVANDLSTVNFSAVETFFAANLSDWDALTVGGVDSGQFVEFSSGVNVGSISGGIVILPEPGTATLVFPLLAGAFLLRRLRGA